MRKSVLIITGFIFLIAVSLAFVSADEPMYKNLKVLKKNITKPEMDSVMHFFAMSLGEKCGFCHVFNEAEKKMDFASDANPHKDIARYMMKMTTKLNKKYFTNKEQKSKEMIQAVTCYTCHHGEEIPALKASGEHHGNMPPPPPGGMGNMPGDSSKHPGMDSSHSMPTDSTKMPGQ